MRPTRGFLLGLCGIILLHLTLVLTSAEEYIPDAGVGTVHPICDSGSEGVICRSEEEELVASLERDEHIAVTSSIEVGELLCESLVEAPESTLLRFAITSNETVVATRTSFSVVDGDVFTDSIDRKVWIGDVVDPAPPADSVPSTISMTWTTPCDVETFLLKMTSGSTQVRSVPCAAGSSSDICMVELEVEFSEEDDPVEVEAEEPSSQSEMESAVSMVDAVGALPELLSATMHEVKGRSHNRGGHGREGDAAVTPSRSGRGLQSSTQVDVMVLYSPEAMSSLGGLESQQMETTIAEAFVQTNQAMLNSDIPLEIVLVHVAQLPYSQESAAMDVLTGLSSSEEVGSLRDAHSADLVQLIGDFTGSCGAGYIFNGYPNSGFSVAKATCLENFTHTHEIGHNLGCRHDRENDADSQSEYAHGLRYCTGTSSYRTIMGLDTDCNVRRVNYFSNPDVYYLGLPTGTSTENNARQITDNMLTVANFREEEEEEEEPECVPAGDECAASSECCDGTCTDAGVCGETCSNGLEGIDANGVVCCPLACGQCGGTGCDRSGAAAGLGAESCCGGGVKASGEYCDETGEAPCIIGSRPAPSPTPANTCSNGLEGIDANGVVCCPLACGQCGGTGCDTAGAAAGLGAESCCGGSIKASGEYCEETDEAPCIIGSRPASSPTPAPTAGNTCSNGLEGIDGNGVVCCPLACGQCGGTGCDTAGAAAGLGAESCCGGSIKASDEYCDETDEAPCIIGSRPTLISRPANTCSNGLEGIDANGVVCCPLACGQCGGAGCTTSGAAAGLGAESCCGGSIKATGVYCDETDEAPCII